MKLVEMVQAMVDGKIVRDRVDGHKFRFNGEVLERKTPDEDGFRQISKPGANVRERVQKLLNGETVAADKGVTIRMRDSRIEMRFPCDRFLFRDLFCYPPTSSPFDPDDEDYYVKEPFNSLADLWDVVEKGE